MLKKVLVANRGEIALRIMKTLRKMDIKSVAVYSNSDAQSLHVQYADESYCLEHNSASQSYMSIKNIIKAAKSTGVDAIHPGYGFLSENAQFAQKVEKEGIILIGPSANAIKKMGDKIQAKKIAKSSKVNTIPGYIGNIKNKEEAINIAKEIGFPVMIKAASGGGGKGIRIVHNAEQMSKAYEKSVDDAMNNYLDKRVFIEKLIHNKPRHIEIQVLADQHGNIVCLGERECSIQRSHQKIIEEAPSVFLDSNTRKEMYEQSKLLVKKVGYYSAGTIEFIVDANKNFYFLEMNTRLQVEHTVTELVTGIDIVEQMVKIASGEKLSIHQEKIKVEGHAIECRICAEEPEKGFLPSSGRIIEYQEPKITGVRLDSGITTGSEVSSYYDSMIAKLCTWANTRDEAIDLMKNALGSFVIRGISHNISFLEAIISNKHFVSGNISTLFIQEEYPKGFSKADLVLEFIEIFIAAGLYIFLENKKRDNTICDRINSAPYSLPTRWIVKINDNYFSTLIRETNEGYHIRQGEYKIDIQSDWVIGNTLMSCVVNGMAVHIKIQKEKPGYILSHGGASIKVCVMSPQVASLEALMKHFEIEKEEEKALISPLSGQILKIACNVGDTVEKDQELIVLVAMKMQNSLKSPKKAQIKKINTEIGQNVHVNDELIEFE